MKIAVLITCHNRKGKTVECLSLLYSSSLSSEYDIDVFLVDDGSVDGTSTLVKSLFPKVKIIQGDGSLFWNRGMCLAWDTAARIAEYDFYLWLNDDTFLLENSLNMLLESSGECDHRAIIIGSTKSVVTNEITYGGRDKEKKLLIPNGVLQLSHYINGNVVLIPKYVYSILGKLDPVFHHALGDIDYGLRAYKNQIRVYVAPEYVGYCEGHNDFAKWCQVERSLKERYKLLYTSVCDCNPIQQFTFESRHYGYLTAIFHWITLHIRLFFPKLWSSRQT